MHMSREFGGPSPRELGVSAADRARDGKPMRLGCAVVARLVGAEEHDTRQGILVKHNEDGTIVLRGENDSYTCMAEGANIILEANLFGCLRRLAEEFQKKGSM